MPIRLNIGYFVISFRHPLYDASLLYFNLTFSLQVYHVVFSFIVIRTSLSHTKALLFVPLILTT